jgi:hypothetical protein
MKRTVATFILMTVVLLLIIITFFISPYKYEWNPKLKQVSDLIDVLRLFYILALLFLVLVFFINKNGKLWIKISVGILVVYCLIKFIVLFNL